MYPKISIITAVRNGAATLEDCLTSVRRQTCPVEHIVIDGASTDATLEIATRHGEGISRLVSEPDDGIYDAMNKGIRLAGGDVIGCLNADDFFLDEHVIATVSEAFRAFPIDALFADLVYVHPRNLEKIVRYYRGAGFSVESFACGLMPPHPTFFVKRNCFEKFGYYKTDYRIAADFELLARLLCKHQLSYLYLPKVIIKMRTGGVSTRNMKSNLILNREIQRACLENGIKTNILKVYMKYFTKIWQLVARPQ
jgi:glycosyltransferase involved in cell wall biosynthesis